MESRVAGIIDGTEKELVWLLEHPPLITAGSSANSGDLIDKNKFPVFETGRGGKHTYHGPGQRVCYVMLDLKTRNIADVRKYVWSLEQLIINTLARFGINGERREGRIGIWTRNGEGEAKIAAIGIRIRKWVTFHGLAINVNPDLSHFSAIVPCGISGYGVTSLKDLGKEVSIDKLDAVLKEEFHRIFPHPLPQGDVVSENAKKPWVSS